MKPTLIDKIVASVNPRAGLRRMQAKMQLELQFRAYDAAQTYATSDWVSATKSGANAEIATALPVLQQKSRDLARNNPYAVRAIDVIVSNTVGSGILLNIKGKKSQVKKLTELWKQVGETVLCDADGRNNFYGLQALAMRAIVESGEVIGLQNIIPTAPQVKLLESDFINSKKDEGAIIQGIEFDKTGNRTKYYLFKKHPGEKGASDETVVVPAQKVAHAFKQQRPGQVRGVPWSHAVIEPLKDLADYQYATVVGKKVAACLVGFITNNDSPGALSPADLKAKRESEMQMTPGTFRYGNPGESVQFSSPPSASGYSEFVREALRSAAAGYGISYEAMTGDYSQVNFTSGRMGNIEFRRNIDYWRWHILIPNFCDPFFQSFLLWAQTQGVDPTGVTAEWVPPSHAMIDPTKEIEALKREVRSGFKTFGQAVREQGLDPDETIIEIAEWNQKFDDLKLSFDSDPRRMSNPGFAQPVDTLPALSDAEYLKPNGDVNSGSTNKTEAGQASDASGVPTKNS